PDGGRLARLVLLVRRDQRRRHGRVRVRARARRDPHLQADAVREVVLRPRRAMSARCAVTMVGLVSPDPMIASTRTVAIAAATSFAASRAQAALFTTLPQLHRFTQPGRHTE